MDCGGLADVLGVTSRTIEHLKQRMCEDGLDAALCLEKKNIKPSNLKFEGGVQEKVIATACLKAPEGHVRWTVRLLADRLVELGVVDSISPMTVHRILKKRISASSVRILEDTAGDERRICGKYGRCS